MYRASNMKKTILALMISCALSAFAYAGSESYSGKEMRQTAPPGPEFNWTGFYIGGQVGYKFTNTDLNLDLYGNWDTTGNDVDKAAILDQAPNEWESDGFEAGGMIGYNAQVSNFVVGLEVAGNYLWVDDSSTKNFIVSHPLSTDSDITLTTSFDTRYLVTVAPRIGYAFGRFLPYITGGLALGEVDFSQGIVYNNLSYTQAGSTSEMETGWMAGGGLQYAFNDHWSVRAQYQYVDLGEHHFRTEGDTFPGFFGDHEIEVREHNVSLGIIYKF